MSRRVLPALLVVLPLAPACGGATADPGLAALIRVDGAQFVAGEIPEAAGGPRVVTVNNQHSVVAPGSVGELLTGAMERDAEAAAIGVPGDVGYWIVPAGAPDVNAPDLPTFLADLSFSQHARGPLTLRTRAVDRDDRHGAAFDLDIVVQPEPPAEGPLVVTLGWDNAADLDLHVVLPNDVEVWSGNINSYQPPLPGEPRDPPTAFRSGAILDVDSNANCVDDGRRLENVVWPADPPPAAGRYVVRVDVPALCGEVSARWWVSVRLLGSVVATARGTASESDTRGDHGAGSGSTALVFEVP